MYPAKNKERKKTEKFEIVRAWTRTGQWKYKDKFWDDCTDQWTTGQFPCEKLNLK